jgi:PAS domain S-box-containing protein
MNPGSDVAEYSARILIVDDEHHNRQLLEDMLMAEGFDLLSAGGGEEALAMVAEKPPDLMLLDLRMPVMDGYHVARNMKASPATKHIPIIVITALDSAEARMLGLQAGAEEFLSRPIDRAELCVRVKNLLGLKAWGDHFERQSAVLADQAALLDLAQDAIVVWDLNGRILLWNRGAEAQYGWSSKEAVGRNARELLQMKLFETIELIEAALLRDGHWEGEAIHYTRDGSRLIVASRWALQRDANGAPLRVLSFNSDITQRKRLDAERLLVTERLAMATALAKIGVWECDLANDTLTWDATMFEIYGLLPVASMPFETWTNAVYPDDLAGFAASLKKVIDEKSRGSFEYRIVRTDGVTRVVSAVVRAVLDEHSNVGRLIGVNMDITLRRNAQEALEQIGRDQIKFKDDFLSHVSHELRSPLTAIKQFSSILKDGFAGELNVEQGEYLHIVLKNVQQLQSMIDDLLEVTRLETGKLTVEPENASIADAVTDVFDTLRGPARAKDVSLSCDLSPNLPSAHTDSTRLRQILIILLDNAVKYNIDGGDVKIRAELLPEDPNFLLVEVSDTGCGIGSGISERLFDRLYQVPESTGASRKGLGLGLYICKELVTRQGGRIWLKQQSQKGSTFAFTLPVFSLNNFISPLFKNERWPAESVALLVVKFGLLKARHSKESQEQWYYEARGLLERCLSPDLDVLLPKMNHEAVGERFFIAAFADERGAAALATRIRDQFKGYHHLNQRGLTLSVSYSMLQPLRQEAGASVALIVEGMATYLEDSLKSKILSEAQIHGQEKDSHR